MDDPVWDATVFTKNRERLLAGDIAQAFFTRVLAQARQQGLLSDEHFTVDGTLIEAWASLKSVKQKGAADVPPPADPGNPTVNFHGERRSNVTHGSTTDPDARLFRQAKGHEARLAYQGHVPHGESPRPGRRGVRDAGERLRRARRGLGDARPRTSSRPSGWSR